MQPLTQKELTLPAGQSTQPNQERSQLMLNVAKEYFAFCKDISYSGTSSLLPAATIAENCQRIFGGKLEEKNKDAFVGLLNNFFKTSGPWVMKVKQQEADTVNNNLNCKLSINIGSVSLSEKLQLHFNDEFKIDRIIADMTPKRGEPTFAVGLDEYLQAPAPQINPNNFQEVFGYTSSETEAFQRKAFAYYRDRFGIETTETYDVKSGIVVGSHFMVLPIKCGGAYALTKSLHADIPAEINGKKTTIQIAEFVLVFNEKAKGKNYGGTFSPNCDKEIDLSHSISFGMYRLSLGDGRTFDISMQSKVPNRKISDNGTVLVKLNLQSKELGQGQGAFLARMDMEKPSENGLYKAFVKGQWYFPEKKS